MSPLDEEISKHGHRYGILVHFVKSALEYAQVKHMPSAPPYLHNRDANGPTFDESCIRCSLEEAIKHINQPGWDDGSFSER